MRLKEAFLSRTLAAAAGWMLAGIGADAGFSQSATLVTREDGGLPIVLSAPHGGAAAIAGAPVRAKGGAGKFVTLRDDGTDALAVALAEAIGRRMGARPYLVVARFHRKFVDANRPPEGAYESEAARPHYEAYHAALRDACAAVRAKWGRGLLLDIHGQSVENEAIFRGTINGRTVRQLVQESGRAAITGPDSIAGRLEALGYKVLPACGDAAARETRFAGGFIVDTFCAGDSGIDAIQLEFGRQFRTGGRVAQTAADMAEAVAAFAGKYLPVRAPGPAGQ